MIEQKKYLEALIAADKNVEISAGDVEQLINLPAWQAMRNVIVGRIQKANIVLRHPEANQDMMRHAQGQLDAFEFILSGPDQLLGWIEQNKANEPKEGEKEDAT